MSAEAFVTLAYEAVLRRPADPAGLATYKRALEGGRDATWLLQSLMESDEYRALGQFQQEGPRFPLDSAPPMQIETHCDAVQLQALWNHVAATWSDYGRSEPFWSVLTDDRFRMQALNPVHMAAFHESGEEELRRLNAWALRTGMILPTSGVCAEFGCGVGRITRALALQFRRVVAFDVSPLHLQRAAQQMRADGIDNVDFVCIQTIADLQALSGIDFFYSVIVLQHNPPPIIADILRRALTALNPGGGAFFQVPTYASDYRFDVRAYAAGLAGAEGMEMHFLPQHVILAIAHDAGLRVQEVQPDWCVGQPGRWISSTFLLAK